MTLAWPGTVHLIFEWHVITKGHGHEGSVRCCSAAPHALQFVQARSTSIVQGLFKTQSVPMFLVLRLQTFRCHPQRTSHAPADLSFEGAWEALQGCRTLAPAMLCGSISPTPFTAFGSSGLSATALAS
jgi:hypothetical protein